MNHTIHPPTLPQTGKNSKWRFVKIVVGVVVIGFLVIALLGSLNSPSLELRRSDAFLPNDGSGLEIANVGTKPLNIVKLAINDRNDCTFEQPTLPGLPTRPLKLPAELKVGDKLSFLSSCSIVRVLVDTDQGSSTYSFNK